ncbi:MAG TPA: RNA polymerase sigma factor [Candidatus Limnocylindrales bacterium]
MPAPAETLGPTDLGALFDRYARELLRYATHRVGESHAEDIVAQTFLTAYEQRHRFDATRGEMLPWLYGICTNLLRRHRRDEIRALKALMAANLSSVDPPSGESVDVARALASLSGRQRDVLLLHAVAGLDYAEVAAALGIPLGTVRSALHRARAKVRAALGEGPPSDSPTSGGLVGGGPQRSGPPSDSPSRDSPPSGSPPSDGRLGGGSQRSGPPSDSPPSDSRLGDGSQRSGPPSDGRLREGSPGGGPTSGGLVGGGRLGERPLGDGPPSDYRLGDGPPSDYRLGDGPAMARQPGPGETAAGRQL